MLLIYFLLNFVINPTKVYLNLDKPNDLIIHTGITFINNDREIRYDFRAFNENRSYITTEESRKNITEMFPDLSDKKYKFFLKYKGLGDIDNMEFILSKELYWGTSKYSIEEIIELEKGLNKKYILGVYDCRHYVNELSKLCLNRGIPIWNLKSLL
tara:strand:+ start:407 stop:874 length:468 start_codon:yes stop_codon:yes gene_type:complete